MQLKIIASCIGAAVIAAGAAHAEEKIHELRASPATVHRGFFDASLKPALTIDSGDIVRLWTTTGNPRYFESLGVPKEKIPAELYASFEGAPGAGRDDHTLDGPIAVRGAEIGDTVEIKIRSIDLWLPIAAMGFRANRGSLPEDFPYSRDKVLFFDPAKKAIEGRSRYRGAGQTVLGRDRGRTAAIDGARAKRAAQRLRRQHGQS